MLTAGLTSREVARRLTCSHATIVRLQRRAHETGSVDDRPRSGRPRVTSRQQDRRIRAAHLRNRFLKATETAKKIVVSPSTVRRRLHEENLRARRPYRGKILTDRCREKRLQ